MAALLHELETIVVDSWPAAETAELGGWLLRASGGPTHRGNSVATLAASGPAPLSARIEQAERWYVERGQRPLFQLGPCALPVGLDAALAARGYVVEGGALCAVAPASEVLESSAPRASAATELEASVTSSPSAEWLHVNATASRFAGAFEGFLGFVTRLGPRCRFVSVRTKTGEPAAVALGITSGERLGVYAMLTAPTQRRQGAGRAALHALARSALGHGQGELYLLVEGANVAARGLYAGCGFRDVYAYHYRAAPPVAER
jgi:ribosomal protein S18 acetylase RimI-like enzyme